MMSRPWLRRFVGGPASSRGDFTLLLGVHGMESANATRSAAFLAAHFRYLAELGFRAVGKVARVGVRPRRCSQRSMQPDRGSGDFERCRKKVGPWEIALHFSKMDVQCEVFFLAVCVRVENEAFEHQSLRCAGCLFIYVRHG